MKTTISEKWQRGRAFRDTARRIVPFPVILAKAGPMILATACPMILAAVYSVILATPYPVILAAPLALVVRPGPALSSEPVNLKAPSGRTLPGIDVFIASEHVEFRGKRIGLITNHTGTTSRLEHSADAIVRLKDPRLVRLFSPEHGLRGEARASQKVGSGADPVTGLPLISLYENSKRPTREHLAGLDALFYDIQDIGSRSYTYISTMLYSMEEAAKAGVEFVVLDRPVATRGDLVDGPILEAGFESFIGAFKIPYVYGMTPGELASWANDAMKINVRLRVVKMEGYDHSMDFQATGLPWIPPSPHIPRPESALLYPATGCMGELQTICEGVGYTLPFELAGREWIDPLHLSLELEGRGLPGVRFRPARFKPFYGKFAQESCGGVHIMVTNRETFRPFETQVHLLTAIEKLYPGRLFGEAAKERLSMFDKATGTDKLRLMILKGIEAGKIVKTLNAGTSRFMESRGRHLLYP